MIDTHAHIDASAFNADRADVIARAWEQGVQAIIVPAISPDRFENVRTLAASDPRIYNGAGVHPHHAHEATEADLAYVEAWCSNPKTVAVGEIGLDYHYDFCPKDVQQRVFREQLRIAKRVGKPVIVHNRESDADVLGIINEEQDGSLQGVLHCFSSSVEVMQRAVELGMHVSFTGNITFKQSALGDVVRQVPAGRWMIETDSPYITPVPYRGQRNEPSHVRLVAEKIAELRSMTFQDVIAESTATARKLFGLMALLLVVATTVVAQPTFPNEDDFEFDDAYDRALEVYELDSIAWAKYLKPRTFGVGFTLGFNTVVERQQIVQEFFRKTYPPNPQPNRWVNYGDSGSTKPISYDGLVSFGGSLMYRASDAFTVEATYLYTKNDVLAERFGVAPTITNIFESALLYTLNPYSKVNFMATAGATLAIVNDETSTVVKYGPNVGFGIGVPIPSPIGVFYPKFDVRFNFMLGQEMNRVVQRFDAVVDDDPKYISPDGLIVDPSDPSRLSVNRANVTTLYSIPRLTITWFPTF
jgi:TatD DNase family protein